MSNQRFAADRPVEWSENEYNCADADRVSQNALHRGLPQSRLFRRRMGHRGRHRLGVAACRLDRLSRRRGPQWADPHRGRMERTSRSTLAKLLAVIILVPGLATLWMTWQGSPCLSLRHRYRSR